MSVGADPGVAPQDVPRVAAGDGGDRALLEVHVGAALAHAPDDRADQRRRVRAVARAFGAGHDDRRGIVGLDAAVQKVQRLDDPAAAQHVVDRDAVLVQRLRVAGRVLAMRDLDHRRLLGPRAVLVHVAHEGRREPLRRAGPAVGRQCSSSPCDRHSTPAGAAHAQLAVAVHRAVDHDRAAHASLDHAGGDADQRLGARAAAPHVHVEVEADAEVARHLGALRRVHQRIREHAVDVGGAQAGIRHGVADRRGGERPRGPARAANVRSLADPDDGVAVAQGARAGGVDLARHGARTSGGVSRPHSKSIRPERASWLAPTLLRRRVRGSYGSAEALLQVIHEAQSRFAPLSAK